MKTLVLMRHAKSSWQDDDVPDHDRPLNERGRKAAPRMGALLSEQELRPERILCSTAQRARQTAAAVVKALAFEGPLDFYPELYLAPPERYVQCLNRLPRSVARVLVIGHNPGLEKLLEDLSGRQEALPTAAIAQLALSLEDWAELRLECRADLLGLWRPKELD